jgi:hypothetical protein
LADESYLLTLAEEAQESDRHPVNAYLLTMLLSLLACSFGASLLRTLPTIARKQGDICSCSCEDGRWLAVAYYGEPSFLGVFRL